MISETEELNFRFCLLFVRFNFKVSSHRWLVAPVLDVAGMKALIWVACGPLLQDAEPFSVLQDPPGRRLFAATKAVQAAVT